MRRLTEILPPSSVSLDLVSLKDLPSGIIYDGKIYSHFTRGPNPSPMTLDCIQAPQLRPEAYLDIATSETCTIVLPGLRIAQQ
jgi:hypothetical protein